MSESRKQFEAWECDADQGPQTDPMWLMYSEETNTYGLDKIQDRWVVWQASREAQVIDLPEEVDPLFFDHIRATGVGYNTGIQDSRKAIEAAGLKVKS